MATIIADFELSEMQIANLFGFVKKKFVHWYDLQMEIVDHLASSIKIEMQSNPQLTFESALEKVYKAYGIFGFAKIVQERQLQLEKTAKKRWWSELRSMFKWPRLMLVLLLISTVGAISVSLNSEILDGLILLIYLAISLAFFIYIMSDLRLQKRLLLMQSGASYFSFPFIYEFVVLPNVSQFTSLTLAILLTIGILIKLTSFKLYRKVRSEAALLYPAVFLKTTMG